MLDCIEKTASTHRFESNPTIMFLQRYTAVCGKQVRSFFDTQLRQMQRAERRECVGSCACQSTESVTHSTKQVSLWVQFAIHCMRGRCILFMYNLHRGYNQATIIFATSSVRLLDKPVLGIVDGWGHINNEWSKQSPQPTSMNTGAFQRYFMPFTFLKI
jgi:hypothetical protein